MKTKLLVVVAVSIVSLLAGIAIADIPSSRASVHDALPAPASSTTEPPEPTTTTEAPTTEPDAPAIDPPVTDPTTTDPTATTALVNELPVDRGLLAIVVANGAAISGIARETADQLGDFGYLDIRSTDGTEIAERSAIYMAPGLEAEAERLALDLSINPTQVFPLGRTPELTVLADGGLEADLIVYLGVDIDDR